MGIGIALDFKVYYPKKKIRFGVQMGLPLLRESVNGLESCLLWWENEISNALGDHRISNPESGLVEKLLSPHPEPDCFPLSPWIFLPYPPMMSPDCAGFRCYVS